MPTRRQVLLAGLATVAGPALPLGAGAQSHFSLEDFLTLSARLTGAPASALNADFARLILTACEARGLLPELKQLASAPGPTALPSSVADELVGAWFSGIVDTPTGPVMGTYGAALLWSTSPLHPAGTCGGLTGYWASPPTL